jgi:glycerophosphoryl diester phosphodiesterase
MIYILIFSLCFLLLLFLISPASRKHPDRNLLKGAFIAHRGLHNKKAGIPENSLLSFQKAIEKGFPIEIDVHLTKDGEIVVFHDEDTKRMCGIEKKIEACTLSELKELELLSTDQKIPTLQECLELVDGRVFLLIEFKMVNSNTDRLCEKANEILSKYKGKYLIQSFYPQVVRWFRIHRPDLCRGQLSGGFSLKNPAKFLLGKQFLNFIGRPDFISYEHQFSQSVFFRFATFLGAAPVCWTFRSKEELMQNGKHAETWIFENFDPNLKK